MRRSLLAVLAVVLPLTTAAQETKDVVDVAVASPNHKTLVAAVKAADYVIALKNPGPLTVFAPTDEAFARLPRGTVEELLKPEKRGDLEKLLQYHVTPSTYLIKDMHNGFKLGQANGKSVKIEKTPDGKVKINGANILATIRVSNGVVHVIDQVLLPPAP